MLRIPIRAKVAGSLAVPLLALLVVSTFEVRQASREVGEVRDETDLASAVTGPAGLITTLQNERIWVSLELTGLVGSYEVPVEGYDETRAQTDRALTAFREDVESKGGAVEATFRDALDDVGELEVIRRDIDAFTAPRDIVNMEFTTGIYGRYSELIHGLLAANARVTGQVDDTRLRQATELAVLASRQVEFEADLARETVTIATLTTGGIDTKDELIKLSGLLSSYDRSNRRILTSMGQYADVVEANYPDGRADTLHDAVAGAIAGGGIADLDAFMEVLQVDPDGGWFRLRDVMIEEVAERADDLNAVARMRQRTFVVLGVVALALAAVVAWLISRSITGPMQKLTHQARELAHERLPGAVRDILDTPQGEDVRIVPLPRVEATTRDEVSEVVDALNTVQDAALELAAEQAVLRRNVADSFVNLARRNQGLLNRQIEFITELESREADPDSLASLFRLDHLATRMRRNAESLLVLAGTVPMRRLTAPVRISDVVRAALGEVEDYQRVRIDRVELAMIRGAATADLAHLLAEMIENALTFSPPAEEVVVHGRWRTLDVYRITVVDQGLGMSPAEVAQANIRLAGSESLTVAPSKYLGQHVAGNLAARHGISVQLEAGAFKGVVATVDLPPTVVDAAQEEPVAVAPGPPPRPNGVFPGHRARAAGVFHS